MSDDPVVRAFLEKLKKAKPADEDIDYTEGITMVSEAEPPKKKVITPSAQKTGGQPSAAGSKTVQAGEVPASLKPLTARTPEASQVIQALIPGARLGEPTVTEPADAFDKDRQARLAAATAAGQKTPEDIAAQIKATTGLGPMVAGLPGAEGRVAAAERISTQTAQELEASQRETREAFRKQQREELKAMEAHKTQLEGWSPTDKMTGRVNLDPKTQKKVSELNTAIAAKKTALLESPEDLTEGIYESSKQRNVGKAYGYEGTQVKDGRLITSRDPAATFDGMVIPESVKGDMNEYLTDIQKTDPKKYEQVKDQLVLNMTDKERLRVVEDALSHKQNKIATEASKFQKETNPQTLYEIKQASEDMAAISNTLKQYDELYKSGQLTEEQAAHAQQLQQQAGTIQKYLEDPYIQETAFKANILSAAYNAERKQVEDLLRNNPEFFEETIDQQKNDQRVKDYPVLGGIAELGKSALSIPGYAAKSFVQGSAGLINMALHPLSDEAGQARLNRLENKMVDAMDMWVPGKANLPFYDENGDINYGNIPNIVAETTAKMMGQAITATVTGGASELRRVRNLGNMFSTYGTTKNEYYDSAIEAGMTEKQAGTYSQVAAGVTSLIELINPDFKILQGAAVKGMPKLFLKYFTEKGGQFAAKQVIKNLVGKMSKEELEEFAQLAGDAGVNYFTNKYMGEKYFKQDWKATEKEALQTAVITAFSTLAAGAPSSLSIPKAEKSEYLYQASKNPDLAIQQIQESNLSEEDKTAISERIWKYNQALRAVPENLHPQKKRVIAPLILKRQQVTEQLKNPELDEVFKPELEASKKEIDKAILAVMVGKATPGLMRYVEKAEDNAVNGDLSKVTWKTAEEEAEEQQAKTDAEAAEVARLTQYPTTNSAYVQRRTEQQYGQPIGPDTREAMADRERERDQLIENRKKMLGEHHVDPLADMPDTVAGTVEKVEEGKPVDPIALEETIEYMQQKVQELNEEATQPMRQLTHRDIKTYRDNLEADIAKLQEARQNLESAGKEAMNFTPAKQSLNSSKKGRKAAQQTQPSQTQTKEVNPKTQIENAIKEGTLTEGSGTEHQGVDALRQATAPSSGDSLTEGGQIQQTEEGQGQEAKVETAEGGLAGTLGTQSVTPTPTEDNLKQAATGEPVTITPQYTDRDGKVYTTSDVTGNSVSLTDEAGNTQKVPLDFFEELVQTGEFTPVPTEETTAAEQPTAEEGAPPATEEAPVEEQRTEAEVESDYDSKTPGELAVAYDEEVTNPTNLSEEDRAIERTGINKISEEDFNEHAGKEHITNAIARSYFGGKGKTLPIDTIAQAINHANFDGDERVTPEHLTDFMIRFPDGQTTTRTPAGNKKLAEINEAYKKKTGKSLNKRTAKLLAAAENKTKQKKTNPKQEQALDLINSEGITLANVDELHERLSWLFTNQEEADEVFNAIREHLLTTTPNEAAGQVEGGAAATGTVRPSTTGEGITAAAATGQPAAGEPGTEPTRTAAAAATAAGGIQERTGPTRETVAARPAETATPAEAEEIGEAAQPPAKPREGDSMIVLTPTQQAQVDDLNKEIADIQYNIRRFLEQLTKDGMVDPNTIDLDELAELQKEIDALNRRKNNIIYGDNYAVESEEGDVDTAEAMDDRKEKAVDDGVPPPSNTVSLQEHTQRQLMPTLPKGVSALTGRVQVDPIQTDAKKLKNPGQIIADLAKHFMINTRYKLPRKRAGSLGFYDFKNKVLNIKRAKDYDTAIHEFGHATDDAFDILNKLYDADPAIKVQLQTELSQLMPYGSQPPDGIDPNLALSYKLREGWAEFVRAHTLNPNEANVRYPELVKFFNKNVDEKTRKALEQFGRDVRMHDGASSSAQIASNTDFDMDELNDAEAAFLDAFRGPFESGKFSLTWLDRFKTKWINSMHAFNLGQEFAMLYGDVGRLLPDDNAEMMARLFAGVNYKVNDMLEFGLTNGRHQIIMDDGKPVNIKYLLEGMNTDTEETIRDDMRETISYMIAFRTLEYAAKFGRDNDLTGIDNGLYGGDFNMAKKHLDNLIKAAQQSEAGRNKLEKIRENARRYEVFADALLQYQVDKGRLSEKQYKHIKDNNMFYVALFRTKESGPNEEVIEYFNGKGGTGGSIASVAQYKKAKGGNWMIKDPYQSLIKLAYQEIREADRNEILQSYVKLFEAREGVENKYQISSAAQRMEAKGGPQTLTIYVDGQPQYWWLQKDIYEALTNVNKLRDALGIFGWLNGIIRSGITTSPIFFARNFTRDLQSRMVMSREMGGGTNLRELNPIVSLQKAFGDFMQDENIDDRLFYLSGGGQSTSTQTLGGVHLQSEDAYKAHMKKSIYELAQNKDWIVLNPITMGRKAWSSYEHLLSKGETANRLAEFRKAFRQAKARKMDDYNAGLYAAFQARDLMDFSVAGTYMQVVNQLIPFSNAAVQGLKNSIVRAREDPQGFAMRMLMYVVVPNVLNRLMIHAGGDDEEYAGMPAYIRDLNYVYKIGDKWIAIPKPYDVGMAGAFAERAISKYVYGDDKALDGFHKMALEVLSPFGESDIVSVGGTRPLIEALSNYDFFRQNKLVPFYEEGDAMYRRPEAKRASRLGQAASKFIGITGWELDPRYIDHIIKGYGGFWGQSALQVSNIGREEGGIEKLGVKTLAVIKEPVVRNNINVGWIYEQAGRHELKNRSDFKGLKNMLGDYRDMESGPKKAKLGAEIINVAKTMREEWEHEDVMGQAQAKYEAKEAKKAAKAAKGK